MFQQKTILEVKAADRIHRFECDPNSPLGEVFDALAAMKSFIVNEINERDKAEKQKQEEANKPKEESCSEGCKPPEEVKEEVENEAESSA